MRQSNALDAVDIYRLVNQAIDSAGGETAFAEKVGVSRQFVHTVMRGGRNLPPRFLEAVGVRRVITTHYEIVE